MPLPLPSKIPHLKKTKNFKKMYCNNTLSTPFLTKKQQKYFCIQNELLWCLLVTIVSVWDCSEAWDCGTCLITLVNNNDNTISLVCWPVCKFCDYRDNEFARDTLIRKYDTSLNMTSLTDMIKSHQILLNRTYWINISDVSSTM